jgi:two-component system, cell cycle response regulator
MRVFIVDDDPLTLEPLVQRLDRLGHDVVPCVDGESAWEALRDGPDPDVVILDWMLPGIDGLELCRRIREREDGPYVYIVMLTGRTGPENLLAGFEAGADDYLSKPFDWEELEARLRAGERIVNLQNALIEARERLRIQAMQDPLTGVLNHGAILDALGRELDRAGRAQGALSVILADLDEFKSVNDTLGHLAGDRVLTEVARRLRACLRSYDSIGRYGGEEFLLVLPSCGRDEATALAERIRGVVADSRFQAESAEIRVTVSQGVVTTGPPVRGSVEGLIRSADGALYGVKKSGRNGVRCVVLDPEHEAELSGEEVSPAEEASPAEDPV